MSSERINSMKENAIKVHDHLMRGGPLYGAGFGLAEFHVGRLYGDPLILVGGAAVTISAIIVMVNDAIIENNRRKGKKQ